MKIGHIELFVEDITQSLYFFCNILNFELVADQGEFQWIKLGDIEILLRPGTGNNVDFYQNASQAIVFYTNNLDKTAKILKSKGLVFKGTDRSENCLTFSDPDGHWFQLVNPDDTH
ncbi:MAG: VOC family protein [Candidatus Hodarchaeales archaeon]|jgi:catechol 2,3-dioxygenase-like lactoylglutathione lyase family enzyme